MKNLFIVFAALFAIGAQAADGSIFGHWISNCNVFEGEGSTSEITIMDDGRITSIDRLYWNDDCSGAPVATDTVRMHYLVLETVGSIWKIKLSDLPRNPDADDQTIDVTARLNVLSDSQMKLRLIGATIRNSAGELETIEEAGMDPTELTLSRQ
jgi:hypothetical protein